MKRLGGEGMVEKNFEGAIKQVVEGAGKLDNNNMLVRYSNDFSINRIMNIASYEEKRDVFFSWHEFKYNEISEGYEPYLSIIAFTTLIVWLIVLFTTGLVTSANSSSKSL